MKRRHFRTIWHPIFYTLIRMTRPRGYKVQYEVPLGTLPPRADLLILARQDKKIGRVRELPAIHQRLGMYTVLEYKGGTSSCEPWDIGVLLGYGSLYAAQQKVESGQVVLMLLAPRLEQRTREGLKLRGVVLRGAERGVWEGELAGHPFYFLELDEVWQAHEANEPLALATRAVLDDAFELKRLTKRTAEIYYEIGHALKGPVHYREEDMEGQKAVRKSMGRGIQKVLSKFSPAERLAGLAPAERLAGLAPAERLAGLPAQEVLSRFAPAERLAGLATAERLTGLAPVELLSALGEREKRELLRELAKELESELKSLADKS